MSAVGYSQVGIGTTLPNSTLDIVSTNPTGNSTNVDGILIPRVDRERALSMAGTTTSTMIFVNSIATGTATGTAINITSTGFYFYDGSVWQRIATGASSDWALTGNAGTTAATNFIGTTDVQDFVIRTSAVVNTPLERMRITPIGNVGINAPLPTATALLSITTNTNLIRSGIDMTLTNATAAATGLNITTANAFVNGITVNHNSSATTSSLYGIGGILSSTNIVSGFNAYRTGSGRSYGLYGINGTIATYAPNVNTWAAFLQGRTVISSETSPTSLLGTDLEVRNTTSGALAPATVSLRQTTALTTTGSVLANLHFGDNYVTTPQAQIQILRDAAASSASDMPTAMTFSTIPDASATLIERMRIESDGDVGIGVTPSASAKLDISATNKGLLIPNVALTARNTAGPITAPATSLLVYNTATAGASPNNVVPGYYYWSGVSWIAFTGTGGNDWSINGNSGTVAANYVGTSDAVDFKISTTGTERMRVLSGGRIIVNNIGAGFAGDRFSVYNTTATDYAINGYSSSTGVGVYGENTGAGTGILGFNNSTGIAVRGLNTSTGAGVFGSTAGSTSAGVFGLANVVNGSGVYGTSNGANANGIFGNSTGDNGNGVYGQSTIGINGTGVLGFANNTGGDGVYGEATQAGRYGVWGVNNNATGLGVRGSSTGTSGTGVYGNSSGASGFGVYGLQTQLGRAGVYGINDNANGFGVQGTSIGANGYGVFGTGTTGFGVVGSTTGTLGFGVMGTATGTSGVGVYGNENQPGRFGVLGLNNNDTGIGSSGQSTGATGVGVTGVTTGANGTGVIGSSTGTNADGVYGQASGATGYGVWGVNNNDAGLAVVGSTTGANATAVAGLSSGSNADGVYGQATGATAFGVWGVNNNATGVGTVGDSSGTNSSGVLGRSTGSNGIGVYGTATSATGSGLFGLNSNTIGTGMIAAGNNAGGVYLTAGSGGAFNGTAYGSASWGTTVASGIGVAGAGNNEAITTLGATGSGGAFTGNRWAMTGVATITGSANDAIDRGVLIGQYVSGGSTTDNVYVGARVAGVNYKILGTGGGSVSTTMKTSQGERILFAPEATENWFFDMGEVELVNGKATVILDPIFVETLSTSKPFKVFVQAGENTLGSIRISRNQVDKSFVVEDLGGASNGIVQYSVYGIWRGKENIRLPELKDEDRPKQVIVDKKSTDNLKNSSTKNSKIAVNKTKAMQPIEKPIDEKEVTKFNIDTTAAKKIEETEKSNKNIVKEIPILDSIEIKAK